jgi:site-specific DNA-methyltransferase (adenine-specific)
MRLINDDCLNAMASIPSESVDMVLCDLPYGTTACKWDAVIPFEPLWREYRRVCKPNAAVVLTASQPFTSALGASNLRGLKYQWYWRKTRASGHLNAKKMPMKDVEDVLVFYDNPPTYTPQGVVKTFLRQRNSASDMARGVSSGPTSVVSGGITRKMYVQEATNYPRQVLDIPSEGKTVHPTQKPVALMEYLIRTYTKEHETVLDNTMGSGTTGVACVRTFRKFIGIERDSNYFEIARERIRAEAANLEWLI